MLVILKLRQIAQLLLLAQYNKPRASASIAFRMSLRYANNLRIVSLAFRSVSSLTAWTRVPETRGRR